MQWQHGTRRIVIKLLRSNKVETRALSTKIASRVPVKRSKSRRMKSATNAFMYSSILLLLVVVASATYRPNQPGSAPVSVGAERAAADVSKPSVDQLAVARLAANTAEVANLSVATEVSNAAITMNIKSDLSQKDEVVITKPQTFEPANSTAIVTYKTVAGDTAQSVAARYGISPQTLKWANNMTSDALAPGVDMTIPTVDGVVYTTKDGDSIDAIAEKYKSEKARIVSKNDLEISGLVAGQKIVLPGGVLPENERPGYAPVRRTVSTGSAVPSGNPLYTVQAGNRYSYGYCTWYAYNRRAQLGRPVGSFWGNASSWASAAIAAGYGVTRGNPGVGDVMQNGGGAGHVAVVERINPDGSIVVSEMNYYGYGGGWNRISERPVKTSEVMSYTFIK